MAKPKSLLNLIFVAVFGSIGWQTADAAQVPIVDRIDSSIAMFRNGEYQKSADSLHFLLNLVWDRDDSLTVLKYLGFSYCMLSRTEDAKTQFRIALDKDPGMELDTLESPPTITVIFKRVQLERLEKVMAKIDTTRKAEPKYIAPKKNPAVPIVLLTAAVASAGAGGYYLFNGHVLRQKYRSITSPDQNALDRSYAAYRNAYITSAAFGAVTAVLLPISIYLFVKKPSLAKHVGLENDSGVLTLRFSL
jgi:hypothetical protein